ncbi:energy transducer TonB [Sulfurospirillum halorespirans]|uniref:TonB-like protein n=1 Tax=Sulfurospirillum halorespirans DSM 13726 TaxID=1193502 RepID=A0A1D7TNC8_9BACT|nr:energy transducer TonB [Sulfurospirillum halorespirans]AOO66424.1 TonB-like protein [Sulfurospirillum halorespirans DSM 13726]
MKASHFFAASFGTLFLHVMIAYALFMGSMMIPKPAMREFIVTQVSFLDEPKPMPVTEEIKHDVTPPPEPIVAKKPEKKVPKEIVKTVPTPKQVVTSTPSPEPFVEQRVEAVAPAKAQEQAISAPAARQSDDLLSIYLAKVRQKIQESLRYPSMAKKMGVEGEAVVQFLIHANGTVDASSIKIAKSSGKVVLDRNAIDAVLDATPFEFPPKEALEIAIPVVFKLKS